MLQEVEALMDELSLFSNLAGFTTEDVHVLLLIHACIDTGQLAWLDEDVSADLLANCSQRVLELEEACCNGTLSTDQAGQLALIMDLLKQHHDILVTHKGRYNTSLLLALMEFGQSSLLHLQADFSSLLSASARLGLAGASTPTSASIVKAGKAGHSG